MLDALRVSAGADVLRLERRGESADGLAIRRLDEPALGPLELEQVPQIVGVQDQLLVAWGRDALRRGAAPVGDALDRREQLERAERLAHVGVRAGLVGEPAPVEVGARQQHDRDRRRQRVVLQPAAEREPVHSGHGHVQHDRVGPAVQHGVERLLRVPGLVELDVHGSERRPEKLPDPRIVVD